MNDSTTACIVLYKNNREKLKKVIESFLNSEHSLKLFLVDNSPTTDLMDLANNDKIHYIHNPSNPGFGTAHNLIISKIQDVSDYHIILNPDVYFSKEVVSSLIKELKANKKIGIIAPKIEYPDGSLQHSIRKFPNPLDLIIRRIGVFNKIFKKRFEEAHYLDKDISQPLFVDCISGCFQMLRTEVFCKIDGFDERYFMYMEDIDICRKVRSINHLVYYYPNIKVAHYFEKGSSKSIRLLITHLNSAFKYFYKWR